MNFELQECTPIVCIQEEEEDQVVLDTAQLVANWQAYQPTTVPRRQTRFVLRNPFQNINFPISLRKMLLLICLVPVIILIIHALTKPFVRKHQKKKKTEIVEEEEIWETPKEHPWFDV